MPVTMTPASPEIGSFTLYGEDSAPIAAEFVHIEPISERSSLHEWTISPHSHPGILQLLFLESGQGLIATEGSESTLAPPTLVVLPGGSVHAFRFSPTSEGWVLSLATDLLSDSRLAALAAPSMLASPAPRWTRVPADEAARLSWLLADLARQLSGSRSGRLSNRVAAQIAMLLAMAEEVPGMAPALLSRQGELAGAFARLVEAHFRDGWSVAHYAEALATTPQTLTRACRARFGKAPRELVLDRTLLEAMRALTYTAAGITSIAHDLGFADAAYFARFFRARAGMTASAFRRERAWLRAGPI